MRLKLLIIIASLGCFGGCSSDRTGGTSGDSISADVRVDSEEETSPSQDASVDVPPEAAADTDEPEITMSQDFGEPCSENADCDSGWCVEGPTGYICTQTCVDACPTGYLCKSVLSASNATVFLCLPQTQESCAPCAADFQCGGGACLDIDRGSYCAFPCESADDCPDRYACTDDPSGGQPGTWCIPDTGSCTCNAYKDEKTRSCEVTTRGVGRCFGFQACKTSTGWLPCTANTPAPEACDGIDNDCNGLIDDGLAQEGQPCSNEVDGVGTCEGISVCLADQGWLCQGQTPALETCDAQDNDCDGDIDEDFRDAEGKWTTDAHCGYCNNGCAEKIPNGVGECGGTPDEPVCVVKSCNEGYVQFNQFQCLPPVDVTCINCTSDNECLGGSCAQISGEVDPVCVMPCDKDTGECPTGFSCQTVADSSGSDQQRCVPVTNTCSCTPELDGQTRQCGSTNAFGTCYGIEVCDATVGWIGCDAPAPQEETCDNEDNDCNGVIDDNPLGVGDSCNTTNQAGSCQGTFICQGAGGLVCTAATPLAETCDYNDNDCNGTVDDPWVDQDGDYVSDENCGVCGATCDQDIIPGAISTACVKNDGNPRCEVVECETGYFKFGPLTCLPVADELCTSCASDANCTTPGDKCLTLSDGTFCGRSCAADSPHGTDCPNGFTCTDMGDAGLQCVPNNNSCTCLPQLVGDTRTCLVSNGLGTCYGQETCDADAGWTGCTALTPSEEVCDGVDNDCNAAIDDLPNRGNACSNTNNFGTCQGILDCASSPQLECVGPVPAAEVCDSIDNNCDGATDEGYDDVGEGCTEGIGVCANPGIRICNAAGNDTVCSATEGQPDQGGEICDGLDNDCDGFIDNNLLGAAPLCANQLGVCKDSIQTCLGSSGGYAPCNAGSYGPDYEQIELTCDGLDNDCDGETDNVDIDGDGQSPLACGGTDCDDLNPLAYQGAAETCGDNRDNDCNGTIDDKDVDGDDFIDNACIDYPGPLPITDCNDANPNVNPDQIEVCTDDVDNDCDGSINNLDLDGDKVIALACGGTDCNDDEPTVRPGALEICDGLDNDCNTIIDDKDLDVDGHVDEACTQYTGPKPVDDCDDANVGVNPDQFEVCGNALDEDCSGAPDDKDIDSDGAFDTDPLCGGDDCNDNDPMVYPGAPEYRDGKDNDCDPDGKADEGVITPGAVVITEIFYDSSQTPDENFEWIELWNPSDRPVNIRTWEMRDAAGGQQEITVINEDVIVPARGFATLCRTGEPEYNGGVTCSYEYGFFQLGNSADEIFLSFDGSSPTVVDQVEYQESPWPSAVNRSLTLDPDQYGANNNDDGNWCVQADLTAYEFGPNTDNGTPGVSNIDCSASNAPSIVAVDPDNVPSAGGTPIRVVGINFTASTTVSVDGVNCPVTTQSPSELICVVGASSAGVKDVQVSGGGSDTLANALRLSSTASGNSTINSGQLESPTTVQILRDTWSQPVFAQVQENGVTGGACPADGEFATGQLIVQVGYGAFGSDPRSSGSWLWFPAFCEADTGSTNRFRGAFFVETPGDYAYTSRVSVDGGASWNYLDLDGTANGFDPSALGVATVL